MVTDNPPQTPIMLNGNHGGWHGSLVGGAHRRYCSDRPRLERGISFAPKEARRLKTTRPFDRLRLEPAAKYLSIFWERSRRVTIGVYQRGVRSSDAGLLWARMKCRAQGEDDRYNNADEHRQPTSHAILHDFHSAL